MKISEPLVTIACIAAILGEQGCSSPTARNIHSKAQAWEVFETPKDSARTKVWWFHGETETTREGITADLEAYKEAGVGGVVYYDQVHGKGENALPALSQEWWEMLKFAASEAKRLGLSFESHLSNGYVGGGPWITPEQGMQRLVASETPVSGGKTFKGVLPVPREEKIFRDVAVLALPLETGSYQTSLTCPPVCSTNVPGLDVKALLGKKRKRIDIEQPAQGKSVLINMDFGREFTARSISYRAGGRGKSRGGAMNVPGKPADKFWGSNFIERPDLGQLEVSDDAIHWRKVCDLKPIYSAASSTWDQKTISFPAAKGRYFRLNLHDWSLPGDKQTNMALGNVELSSMAKTDQWEEKAGLYSEYIVENATPAYTTGETIDKTRVIDLTAKMDTTGLLQWDAPEGDWLVLRFCQVPTRGPVKHSRANMKGLECDKLSPEAARLQWDNYFKRILDTLRVAGLPLEGLAMDSQEAGSQNWTNGYEQAFLQRRGYDIRPYLPALAGYVVGSVKETDLFLHDMRRTIADMVSDCYFGTLDSLCKAEGVKFTAQAAGNGQNLVSDNIQAKGRVQKPQGEFWGHHTHGSYDIKEASSAAHLYGKQIASGEAFTDVKLSTSLAEIKNLADYAYAFGLNEFVVCASAYQPWLDKYPGSTGGGRHYCLNRNNTYWKYSKSFWDYQARCHGLMRLGMPVVDLCVYAGDDAPMKLLTYRLPEIPEGYDFDLCTEDALLSRMTAEEGRIVLPDGMSYRLLVIERGATVSWTALQQIASLVKAGVPLYAAERPSASSSLADKEHEDEYRALANKLWGESTSSTGNHAYGKGTVYWGMSLEEALQQNSIRPDIRLKSGGTPKDRIWFAHRQLSDADIYFVNNHSKHGYDSSITLRTSKHYAEYWEPTTGKRYRLDATASEDGLTVRLVLRPGESAFLVASDEENAALPLRRIGQTEKAEAIEGSWQASFAPEWGGPGEVILDSLTDWATDKDERIRHYSGTAVYRKKVNLEQPAVNEHLWIRFPQVNFLAHVKLNGQEVATVWCSPWEADLTPYVKAGENLLEIEVVNSWMNRMIGDAKLPQEKRYTYAYPEVVKAGDRLVPSGIIGDVLLVRR